MIDSSKRLAMGEGLAESNPVIGTNKAAGERKARLDELTQGWFARKLLGVTMCCSEQAMLEWC
jgi:hypothetical protein